MRQKLVVSAIVIALVFSMFAFLPLIPEVKATSTYGAAARINGLLTNVNWTKDLGTMYNGYSLGMVSLADLEAAVDSLPASENVSIIRWAKTLEKYGYANQTTIQRGLDGYKIGPNGLPITQYYGYMFFTDVFSVTERSSLWGFNYSAKYSYETTKWNMTTAFNSWNSTMYAYGTYGLLMINASNNYPLMFGPRWYDEAAEDIDVYIKFYLMGVTGALNDAEYWWNWTNTHFWNSNYGGYYKYGPDDSFECEFGFFYQIACQLFSLKSDTAYKDHLLTDINSRFLNNSWSSPGWLYNVVVHAQYGNLSEDNPERRLQNNLAAWGAIQGLFPFLNSSEQASLQSLLNGTAGSDTAFNLLNNSNAYLYNTSANRYRWSSSDTDTFDLATAVAANTINMLAVVPYQNGSLAIPLEELSYEYLNGLIDHDLFYFNYTTRHVTISIGQNGTFEFLYGSTPFNYGLTIGVWDLTFASDWNSITNAVYKGSLPQRLYVINTPWTTVVVVLVTSPTNTTYTSGTIPVNFTASGGTIDKKWYNCKNSTSWVYASNQTYTVETSMTGFVTGSSYTFYAWANATDGTLGSATVAFIVSISGDGGSSSRPSYGSCWGDWW